MIEIGVNLIIWIVGIKIGAVFYCFAGHCKIVLYSDELNYWLRVL